MSKESLAFLFPGQGSQRVGMGIELLKQEPALFERYLSAADLASGRPISKLTVEGSMPELTDTRVTQPALFALGAALAEYARGVGLRPTLIAGHSVGEFTAVVASGALSVEDGLRLVVERSRLMAEAQSQRRGGMAMISGLPTDVVASLCRTILEGTVQPSNLNAPLQTVVSGDPGAIERLIDVTKEAGATETLVLNVDVASHSEFMRPVAEKLAVLLDRVSWHDPLIPVVANVSGQVLRSGAQIRDALIAQLTQPVLWVKCVQQLADGGCTRFLELGPGRVLGGLVRQILPDAETYASASPRRIASFAAGGGVIGDG